MRLAALAAFGCMLIACASFGASSDDPGPSTPSPSPSGTTAPNDSGATQSILDSGASLTDTDADDMANDAGSCVYTLTADELNQSVCFTTTNASSFSGVTLAPNATTTTVAIEGQAICGNNDNQVTINFTNSSPLPACFAFFFDSDDLNATAKVETAIAQNLSNQPLARGQGTAVSLAGGQNATITVQAMQDTSWKLVIR